MKIWNKGTRRYEPFSPGDRDYPPLPSELRARLDLIPSTTNFGVTYRPCPVGLLGGTWVDCAYVVEAQSYIKAWGIWPDQDDEKGEVSIQDVSRIEPSPHRLPAPMAQRLYDAGESGMGYVLFEITYQDGSRSAHVAGGAVDFVTLAPGKTTDDIADVVPHGGRNKRRNLPAPEYYWCLYGND